MTLSNIDVTVMKLKDSHVVTTVLRLETTMLPLKAILVPGAVMMAMLHLKVAMETKEGYVVTKACHV